MVKPNYNPNPDLTKVFGARVALSQSGKTLVIPVADESSSAKGIDGNWAKSAPDAIPVYTDKVGNPWAPERTAGGSSGGSSGGIMTEALVGVYPDVFMAGISLMGVPCGCWAQNYNDVTGTGNSAQWSGPCAGGMVTKAGQQWGDLVRSYFPGYMGHRPRLQHWHGTADTTLNYKSMAEDVKEWTDLLALSESPTGTDTPKSGTTHQLWKNSCGYTVYETFSLAGVGHAGDAWRDSQAYPGLRLAFRKARGRKCDRCWNYSPRVGEDKTYPTVCERCSAVLKEIGVA
jgi:hypothetical protein